MGNMIKGKMIGLFIVIIFLIVDYGFKEKVNIRLDSNTFYTDLENARIAACKGDVDLIMIRNANGISKYEEEYENNRLHIVRSYYDDRHFSYTLFHSKNEEVTRIVIDSRENDGDSLRNYTTTFDLVKRECSKRRKVRRSSVIDSYSLSNKHMQIIDLWLNDPDKPHSSVLLEAIYAARKSQETADAIYEQYKSTAVPENYVLVYGYCKALSARVATEY